MDGVNDPTNEALLDNWQRGFPIEPRPFDRLAAELQISTESVLERLRGHCENGRVTRVGATCAPNSVSASTLAAIAAPEGRIEEVAAIIGAQPGVNHSYLRENDWNLWFVVTGPDRAHVNETLARIEKQAGLRVLDLRLVRPFNVDLGFSMRGGAAPLSSARQVDTSVFQDADRPVLQALTKGLPLEDRPYARIANDLGRTEADVLDRIRVLTDAGIISRLGVIVRHRALGWRANAMVVWDLPHDTITQVGPLLAAQPGITLCYERVTVEGIWPYSLYTMIHARSRAAAFEVLDRVRALPALRGVPYQPLFSIRCFKQTGAMIDANKKETA
ncbi:siroheme decarboxylase subunit beta [Litoreibacter arenae]|uniref:siroheme decarboxylase n=1 Tax=Litoreibacter arenae DSM 19593 TaxID=1123360 RepID=S9RKB3_9RHOB|nr:Lrp/AsnC family transcriptional regulator [Litoreibacter arenae]EPX78560.1 Heme d1 biosynthesis protein NirD / Heme d1 biosynthesis protein NirL [Litoreibacter arenae DSM 19593]